MDNIVNFKRTSYCGDLRISDAGKTASVCGWVQRQRDLGGLIFVDLRDRTGLLQLSFDDSTARDVFDVQNNELLSKRDAVEEVEAPTTQSLPHCQVIRALYTAERDGSKNYYETYLLDFPESQILAWVLVTATPSYATSHRDYLSDIVFSLTPTR